jgi:membrane protein required for colicin V production
MTLEARPRRREPALRAYDLVMLGLLVLLAWRGSRRGLISELAGLAAFAFALLLAFRLDGELGRWLGSVIPRLTAAEARIVAFLAILLVVSLGVGLAAGLLTDAIRHVPLAGGVNHLGGLLAGAALALLGIWLITACLLLLPAGQLPFTASVHHSETARLLRSVPPQWSRSLRVHLEHFGTVHLKH